MDTAIQATKRQARRKQSTVPFAQIDSTCKRLAITEQELAEALGYARGVMLDWRRRNAVPQVAALAAEALVRRQSRDADSYVLLHISHGVVTATHLGTAAPQKLKIGESVFLLFPKGE